MKREEGKKVLLMWLTSMADLFPYAIIVCMAVGIYSLVERYNTEHTSSAYLIIIFSIVILAAGFTKVVLIQGKESTASRRTVVYIALIMGVLVGLATYVAVQSYIVWIV